MYTGRAGRVEEHPWGIAMLTDDLPRVWDANFVLADRWEGSAAELAAEADRVLGAAGPRPPHGAGPDPGPAARAEPSGSAGETVRQLLELPRRTAAAIEARLFAGLVDGEPVAYASLLLDGAVAQIEDVATHAEHRGKGLARAVVLRCLAETRRAGAELVWLVADDKDWPKELYARLGFDPLGVETMFGRPAE